MKKTICIILIVAFAALFGTSAYFLIDHYRQETKQAELYDSLADMVDSAAETEEEPAEPVLYTEEKTVLPELSELYQQNSDLAGWIQIADTNINYPIMHTPDNPDFYLKHGFDKEYSDYGCPYVQDNCDIANMEDKQKELSFLCATNNPVVDILIGNKLGIAKSMEIENSFKGGTFKKGRGLSNITTVAEKYHGAVSIKTQDTSFVLSVLLIIPQQSKSIPQQNG